MSGAAPDAVLRRVVATLDAAGVPYMLTGSFASSLYGVSRATHDIDFVIAPSAKSLESLLQAFPEDLYYVSREAALEAFARESLFNVVEFETGWKIDFIFRKSRAFSSMEFERRAQETLWGEKIFVASAEDVLLAKLEWAKRSGSDRQIEDAAGVLRTQKGELDEDYLEAWVSRLDLGEQWSLARKAAFEEPRLSPPG